MTDVFISYARTDLVEAERLGRRLMNLGLTVWFDHALTPGLDYAREIALKLNEAKVIVVCWTKAAAESRWVFAEAMSGLHRNNLVPIGLDATLPPAPFETLHTIQMQKWSGRYKHPGWRLLLDRLASMLGQPDLRARDEAIATGRRPGKALVVTFDSAWQGLQATAPSNSAMLREVVARKDGDQRQQLLRYVSGGGAQMMPRGMLDTFFAASGAIGSSDNPSQALEAYLFLIDNYEPSDRIYIFGAGTGSVTARRLSTLIGRCGILQRDRVQLSYDAFRLSSDSRAKPAEFDRFREAHAVAVETTGLGDGIPPIAYLGLWDCLMLRGANDMLSLKSNRYALPLKLTQNVQAARLAAALDEDRAAFPLFPVEGVDSLSEPNTKFRQMWFTGRATDLIGGTGVKHFAEPFLWILEGAEEAGLEIDRSAERFTEAQRTASSIDPAEPIGKIPLAARFAPSNYPFLARRGPKRLVDVAPGAARRWRGNRSYRPTSLNQVRRDLKSPPPDISDEA